MESKKKNGIIFIIIASGVSYHREEFLGITEDDFIEKINNMVREKSLILFNDKLYEFEQVMAIGSLLYTTLTIKLKPYNKELLVIDDKKKEIYSKEELEKDLDDVTIWRNTPVEAKARLLDYFYNFIVNRVIRVTQREEEEKYKDKGHPEDSRKYEPKTEHSEEGEKKEEEKRATRWEDHITGNITFNFVLIPDNPTILKIIDKSYLLRWVAANDSKIFEFLTRDVKTASEFSYLEKWLTRVKLPELFHNCVKCLYLKSDYRDCNTYLGRRQDIREEWFIHNKGTFNNIDFNILYDKIAELYWKGLYPKDIKIG